MTDKKTTTKRRTVTPARLFKQVRTYVQANDIDVENTNVEGLMEMLKASALEEMIADM